MTLKRCFWLPLDKKDYIQYHDEEWGVPVYNDQLLFEMLILEGAQAGLSWYTVLKKRKNYQKAFKKFDPKKVAQMKDQELKKLLEKEGLIRHPLKIYSVRDNARVFLTIQKEFQSFSHYIWSFTDYKIIVNRPKTMMDVISKNELSERISKDLKKRGMNFVGSTIIYAYLQAIGIIDEHSWDCFKSKKSKDNNQQTHH